MISPANSPLPSAPRDQDLADQALAGHGVPSQDPDPAAQFPMESHEALREAKSVLMAGGLVCGVALGCAVGAVTVGPVGVVVGGVVGAIAGAMGGVAVRPMSKRV